MYILESSINNLIILTFHLIMEFGPLLFVAIGISTLFVITGFHKIEEGHVGVYFRGGALLQGITEPGYHWMMPFVTSYDNVQVTVQTDKVVDIPVSQIL